MEESEVKKENGNSIPPAANIPVRDFMVNTAVHFLQNPKVQSSPLSQKRAFLIKKGLTNEEIDAAIEKASVASVSQAQSQMLMPNVVGANTIMYRPSIWSRVHRYGSAVIIVGVVLYGLQQFYKLYIEPLLYGAKKRDSRLSLMEEQLLELSQSLSHLRKSVSTIEEILETQKQELQKYLADKQLESEQAVSPALFLEMKSDISTVKSLLLNRHQFPDVPKISPCIPAWQLVGSDAKNERQVNREFEGNPSLVNVEENCEVQNNGLNFIANVSTSLAETGENSECSRYMSDFTAVEDSSK